MSNPLSYFIWTHHSNAPLLQYASGLLPLLLFETINHRRAIVFDLSQVIFFIHKISPVSPSLVVQLASQGKE